MKPTSRRELVDRTEGGIDWLSCTLTLDALGAERWYTQAQHIIMAIGREGYEVFERSLLGFDGMTAGNNFIGVNHERIYLQLSSSHADEYFWTIDREDLHYSRIDVQATVWFKQEQTNIAKEAFRVLSNGDECVQRRGNRGYRIILGSDGSDTLYVGSPSSRQQGIIYNKARQSEKAHYKNAWRHEIRLRDTIASAYAWQCRNSPSEYPSRHVAYVYAWYSERSLEYDHLSGCGSAVMVKTRSNPSDVDTKLRWLNRQVRPAIEWLTERGHRDSILEALGL